MPVVEFRRMLGPSSDFCPHRAVVRRWGRLANFTMLSATRARSASPRNGVAGGSVNVTDASNGPGTAAKDSRWPNALQGCPIEAPP